MNRSSQLFLSNVSLKPSQAKRLVWFGVILYSIIFSVISILRYKAFSFTDFDFAMYVHEVWKIAHGSAESSIFNNTPIWGVYLELISYLIAPFFILSGHDPRSLLILQSLILGVGALPIFWIASKRVSPLVATMLAFAYLLYPPLWYTNLYEFYPVVFSTLTFLLMFYFMEEDRFFYFILLLLITLSIRIDMAMTVFMFGVYALFKQKPWKWCLCPVLISSSWLYLGLFVIIPKFQGHLNFAKITYNYLGNNFSEVFTNIILHPALWVGTVFSRESCGFVLQILAPLLFTPLGAFNELLMCLPSLAQHLFSGRWAEHTIVFHYTATITPFLFISTIYSIHRYFKLEQTRIILCAIILIATLFTNCLYGPLSKVSTYQNDITVDELDLYTEKLLKKIPLGANVISTFEYSSRLAGRNKYYSMHYIYWGHFDDGSPYTAPKDAQYALINFEDRRMLSFKTPNSDVNLRQFLAQGWDLVDSIGSVMLFRRHLPILQAPYTVITQRNGGKDKIKFAQFHDLLDLVQFSVDLQSDDKFRIIKLTYGFFVLKPVEFDMSIFVQLVDEKGNYVYSDYWKACRGIYPANRWVPGEEVGETYNMLLPSKVPPGRYKLSMALVDPLTRRTMAVRYANESGDQKHLYYSEWVNVH